MTSEASTLHYLTVQDVLWINLQVTSKVNAFTFSKLEEATFYQYSYGDSRNLVAQAAGFLTGFSELAPFETGNAATAFVGCLAFLKINGMSVSVDDTRAGEWYSELLGAGERAPDALNRVVAGVPNFHPIIKPDIHQAVSDVLSSYPKTIERLAQQLDK